MSSLLVPFTHFSLSRPSVRRTKGNCEARRNACEHVSSVATRITSIVRVHALLTACVRCGCNVMRYRSASSSRMPPLLSFSSPPPPLLLLLLLATLPSDRQQRLPGNDVSRLHLHAMRGGVDDDTTDDTACSDRRTLPSPSLPHASAVASFDIVSGVPFLFSASRCSTMHRCFSSDST